MLVDDYEIAHYVLSDKKSINTVVNISFDDGNCMKFTTKSLELFIHALQVVLEQAEDKHNSLRLGPPIGTDTKIQVG